MPEVSSHCAVRLTKWRLAIYKSLNPVLADLSRPGSHFLFLVLFSFAYAYSNVLLVISARTAFLLNPLGRGELPLWIVPLKSSRLRGVVGAENHSQKVSEQSNWSFPRNPTLTRQFTLTSRYENHCSQTYKLSNQRPILQLLHSRRQLRYSGHGCTSQTTLRRTLPTIRGKTEFHFGPYTEFDRSARIGVWLVLHGTNIREDINALTQLTNTTFIKVY